jgi:hypothetical protein
VAYPDGMTKATQTALTADGRRLRPTRLEGVPAAQRATASVPPTSGSMVNVVGLVLGAALPGMLRIT